MKPDQTFIKRLHVVAVCQLAQLRQASKLNNHHDFRFADLA
ncbi:hypothetical protein CES85_1068 [Ochrobactrum quorumnocens]|uniref:Uncharacterized protein n=1 Tax=Ochrobactrum quorumnocens TaxID=271865 RepID=A0A248ULC6_9HYPH|nr:hypothetical protein CES85_1068 [[Ochrobactrum] quorumnocens]